MKIIENVLTKGYVMHKFVEYLYTIFKTFFNKILN